MRPGRRWGGGGRAPPRPCASVSRATSCPTPGPEPGSWPSRAEPHAATTGALPGHSPAWLRAGPHPQGPFRAAQPCEVRAANVTGGAQARAAQGPPDGSPRASGLTISGGRSGHGGMSTGALGRWREAGHLPSSSRDVRCCKQKPLLPQTRSIHSFAQSLLSPAADPWAPCPRQALTPPLLTSRGPSGRGGACCVGPGPKEEAEATNQVEKGGEQHVQSPRGRRAGGRRRQCGVAPVVAVGGWVSF